jgi:hypothetical protein
MPQEDEPAGKFPAGFFMRQARNGRSFSRPAAVGFVKCPMFPYGYLFNHGVWGGGQRAIFRPNSLGPSHD